MLLTLNILLENLKCYVKIKGTLCMNKLNIYCNIRKKELMIHHMHRKKLFQNSIFHSSSKTVNTQRKNFDRKITFEKDTINL